MLCVCVSVCTRMCVCTCSVMSDFAAPWTSLSDCVCVHTQSCLTLQPQGPACQAPLSMGFLRQEYWSGLPFPAPGNLLDPGVEPASPAGPALASRFFTAEPPGKPIFMLISPKSLSPSQISLLKSSSLLHISILLSLKCVQSGTHHPSALSV